MSFDDDYSTKQLHVETEFLRNTGIKPFVIGVGGLNSFVSAPFLEVQDLEGGIKRVSALLSSTSKENGRSSFTPHVTIGLYSQAFNGCGVLEKISTFQCKPAKLTIDQLIFAIYEAREISGGLTVKHHVALQ